MGRMRWPRCDDGMNIGMARFLPTAMVYDGTDEELVWRLTAMLSGTRVERRTSSSGVITHLVHSDRRVDTHAMLVSVGLDVSNTSPTAHHPLQSFITHGATVATTPTHRDENDAIPVQLKGSKEMLIHPPAEQTNRVAFQPGEVVDIVKHVAPLLVDSAGMTEDGLYSMEADENSMMLDVARGCGSSGDEPAPKSRRTDRSGSGSASASPPPSGATSSPSTSTTASDARPRHNNDQRSRRGTGS